MIRRFAVAVVLGLATLPGSSCRAQAAGEPILPKHVTAKTLESVERGLAWLKKNQSSDGSFSGTADGKAYPVSMAALAGMAMLATGSTTTRGPAADEIGRAVRYVTSCARAGGMITGPGSESGRPMHGHGFALLFLATVHGMETDPSVRDRLAPVIRRGVRLIDAAQSPLGGWTYFPGGGDEGSVTVTQIQALRAADAGGFVIPERTLKRAVRYLELCQEADGGIRYMYAQTGGSRLPVSAAAVATIYNAGDYESPIAKRCLAYVVKTMGKSDPFTSGPAQGHGYYCNLYAAQAFYQAGDESWDEYYPRAHASLLRHQGKEGAWTGNEVGPVFGTAVALIILQLPYRFLPVYQR